MKLKVTKRQAEKKSESKVLRREGKIPAIIYSKGEQGDSIAVPLAEYEEIMRGVELGGLPTTVFTLEDESAKERRAIVKGIQYHPTRYDILHLDFEELHDTDQVEVKVPIRFTGVNRCPGVKLGGVLRSVIRHARVRCLPAHLPKEFYMDVSDLGLNASRRLKAIPLPEGVELIDSPETVAAIIAKR